MRPLVIGLLMLASCTSSGPARASTACDLLRPSEIEAVTGDAVRSSGPVMIASPSSEPGLDGCGYETSGGWGTITVAMRRPGQQQFDISRDQAMRQRVGFVDTTANGAPAFIDDGGASVLVGDTFASVTSQSVHFAPIAQRLLQLLAERA
jgi:hypothetical protein